MAAAWAASTIRSSPPASRLSARAEGEFYDPVPPIGEPQLPSFDAARHQRRSLRGGGPCSSRSTGLARAESPARQARPLPAAAFALLTSSQTRAALDLPSRQAAASLRPHPDGHQPAWPAVWSRRACLSSACTPRSSANTATPMTCTRTTSACSRIRTCRSSTGSAAGRPGRRGLLDSTLVVVMGEMGRSPRINAKAGRDHWPQCGFSLLFGGGVKQGLVHGKTDVSPPTRSIAQ